MNPNHPPATAIVVRLAITGTGLLTAPALAQGPFAITRHIIAAGGGASSGGSFAVLSTLGEPAAGPAASGGSYAVSAGFLTPSAHTCYPDCNLDGVLTVADFGCFQTKFVVGNSYADCNADGLLTVADFGCFQTEFVVGCP